MATKGKSVTNEEAGRLFDMINPAILDIRVEGNLVGQIFDNSLIEMITADIPDYEEQQCTLFMESNNTEKHNGTP